MIGTNELSLKRGAGMRSLPPQGQSGRAEVGRSGRPKCLVILAFEALVTGTVAKHVSALKNLSKLDVTLAHVGMLNERAFDVDRYDVIVLHYSLVIAKGFHVSPKLRSILGSASALKVLFIQDEYRWIDATADAIVELGVSVMFTVVNQEVVEQIYHHELLKNVRKEVTLTGYVDEALLKVKVPSYQARSIDVAYRARKVPYWLGLFAMEKWYIGERFRRDAEKYDVRCDISSDEHSRIYGRDWIRFLANAKATLATESGASICDFSGELRLRVDALVDCNPGIEFETVYKKLLQEVDGKNVIHVISPRIFEAAALRTLMINYPGDYSGRLIAWRHYVPLAKDHSNIEEVVAVIKNPKQATEIIENAYREVACDPRNSFGAMVEHFDRVVFEELGLSEPSERTLQVSFAKCTGLEMASWGWFYGRSWLIAIRHHAYRAVRHVLPRFVRLWIKERHLEKKAGAG